MGTQQLCIILDDLMESAYQARCFKKENVQEVLVVIGLMKGRFQKVDILENENTELKVRIEILEAENKKLIERFEKLDQAIEESNNEISVNEIEVFETMEEISEQAAMEQKLFGTNGNNLPKKPNNKIPQK